jgi:hypothetical protein
VSSRLIEIPRREYPQTWWLLDAAESELRLIGTEVVDLSPGAIELRHVARELRAWGDRPENWVAASAESPLAAVSERHRRALSFGPRVDYLVERDHTGELHAGRPFRHLRIRSEGRALTPATSVEIGLYFFGRRPAGFARTAARTVHGFIGLDWEGLDGADVESLAQRELAAEG